MKQKVAILINTCDAYSDAWQAFFDILRLTWPEAKEYPIYLNTEKKRFDSCFFNIKVLNILPEKKSSINWGERLIDCVKRIDEEFILFLLEDYYFEKKIDDKRIQSVIKWCGKDKKLAAISLTSVYDVEKKNNNQYCENDFILRRPCVHYTLNASPTLYRKATILRYTLKNDSPWDWEFFGSIRTWFSGAHFYAKTPQAEDLFLYDIKRGGAIHRGCWVGCVLRNVFEQYSICVDTGDRMVIEDWLLNNSNPPKHNIITIVKNKWKFVKNFCISVYFGIKYGLVNHFFREQRKN